MMYVGVFSGTKSIPWFLKSAVLALWKNGCCVSEALHYVRDFCHAKAVGALQVAVDGAFEWDLFCCVRLFCFDCVRVCPVRPDRV